MKQIALLLVITLFPALVLYSCVTSPPSPTPKIIVEKPSKDIILTGTVVATEKIEYDTGFIPAGIWMEKGTKIFLSDGSSYRLTQILTLQVGSAYELTLRKTKRGLYNLLQIRLVGKETK